VKAGRAAAIAGLVGASVMSLELTAVRLMAPHFGDSAYVWTNVIGVILVGLALGAWLGGRLASGDRARSHLATALWVSAVLTILVPLWSGAIGSALLPQDLPLDAAMPALVRGSFVATAVLFAPPVVCVGCVSPLLITVLAARDGRVGRAAGAIGAMSTLGSLIGTFAATHVLVPELGSRATVWISGGLLAIAGALAHVGAARAAAVAGAWLVAWWGVADQPLRAAPEGHRLLAETESAYQFLQVLEREDDGARLLKINEGLDSAHSVAFPAAGSTPTEFRARAFTDGWYYDAFAALPYFAGDGSVPETLRVLSLGDAAGTFSRLYRHCFADCTVDGVELDPATAELGRAWFGGRPAGVEVVAGVDARVFVQRAAGPYEIVLVDAYEHQVYIPAHVASVEFFTQVARLMAPGGVVAINASGVGFDAPVPVLLRQTLARVFGAASTYLVPQSRNLMIVARKDGDLDLASLRGATVGDADLEAILRSVGREAAWRRDVDDPDHEVLTDDRPVLDHLLEQSLESHAVPAVAPVAGTADPAAAIAEAQALVAAGDGRGARERLSRARTATPELRYWMGAARWVERDLRGASAEFDAALALVGPGEFAAFLEEQQRRLAAEAEPRERARAVARRNGWWVAAISLLTALAAGGLWFRRSSGSEQI